MFRASPQGCLLRHLSEISHANRRCEEGALRFLRGRHTSLRAWGRPNPENYTTTVKVESTASAAVRFLAVVLVTLFSATAVAPVASADHFDIVLLTDKTVYDLGDTVKAAVYLFKGGRYWDPVEPPSLRTMNTPQATTINTTRASAGLYRANITLTPSLLFGNGSYGSARGVLSLRATARDSFLELFSVVGVVVRGHDTAVWIELSNYRPAVGEAVGITVTTLRRGQTVDAENLTVGVLGYHWFHEPSLKSVNATRIGVGRYTATYVIPPEFASARLYVRASAAWSDAVAFGGAVVVVQGLSIWSHLLATNRTTVRFEILVGDVNGQPAAGAVVRFSRGATSYEAMMDAQGRATFETPPSGFSTYGVVGNVTYKDIFQSISGSFFVLGADLDIRPLVASPRDLIVQPRQIVLMRYEARFQGEPLRNASLTYEARTPREIVGFGSVSTDAQGTFSVNFTAPDRSVLLAFGHEVPGTGTYVRGTYLFVQRPDFRIDVDRLALAQPLEVRLTADPAFVGIPFGVFLLVAPIDSLSLNFEWTPLTPSDYYLSFHQPLPTSRGIATQVFLPATLPADREYLFLAFPLNDLTEVTAIFLKPGEGTTSGGGPGTGSNPFDLARTHFGVPMYGWIALAGGALAAVSAVRWRKRRRAASVTVPAGVSGPVEDRLPEEPSDADSRKIGPR